MLHQHYRVHPKPVPPALLVRDIGGNCTGPEVRKANFLRQGPAFLYEFISGIKHDLLNGRIVADPGHKKSSGSVSYLNEKVHFLINEPSERQGLILFISIFNADASLRHFQRLPLSVLNEPGAWDHFQALLREQLPSSVVAH